MTDLEGRVKALLEERSRDYRADPVMPRRVATRSRRRRALVGTGAGLGALAAVVLGAAALRAFAPPDDTAGTPTPIPTSTPVVEAWRGIWPQTTREDGEEAQAAADAGDPEAVWQLDVVEVIRRYTREELGFAQVHFDESLGIAEEDSPGPYTIHVASCEQRDLLEWPPVCVEQGEHLYAKVTVRRLLREDRTGIWFVTGATEPQRMRGEPAPSPEPVPVYPDTFVGVTNDGDLVLASVADGSVIRTLLDRDPSQIDLRPNALSPDGTSVYVTDGFDTEDPRVLRVPMDGGVPVEVGQGVGPVVGPDGRVAFAACDRPNCGRGIDVERPDGGWSHLDVSMSDEEGVASLAWLPDGRLAVSIGYLGDSNPDVRMVDPVSAPRYVLDLPPIGPERGEEGWLVLGYHAPTDGLAVQAYCCTGYAGDPIEAEPVLSVDPDTGEHGPALVDGAAFHVALDRTGSFFLMPQISFASGPGRGEDLFLMERDGHLRRIGEGYVAVAW